MWPDRRILDSVGIEHPIVQAPMIGPKPALAGHVTAAGALGSVGAAAMTGEGLRREVAAIRERTGGPLNLNFFCHEPPRADEAREAAWRARLAAHYRELGLDPDAPVSAAARAPFDEAMAEVVEDLLAAIEGHVSRGRATYAVELDSADGGGLHWLYEQAEVLDRHEEGTRITLRARVAPEKEARLLNRFPSARREVE